MEKSGFFTSNNGDRKYPSDLLARFFSKIFTNGIFDNELAIVTNDDMTVTLKEGVALINGYFYYNDSDKVFTITPADDNQSRVDNLVLRYRKADRQIISEIIEGPYGDVAVAPNLERHTEIYDLRLYKISVPNGGDKITSSMIDDCRFDVNDCGNVVQAVQSPDITNLFSNLFDKVRVTVDDIKGILSEDVAGNLLNKINANESLITNLNSVINSLEISNEILTKSINELSYNLVLDGPAVKTGRQINGKYVWGKYMTYKEALIPGMDKLSVNNLPVGANLHKYEAVIKPSSGSGPVIPNGYRSSATDFFKSYATTNGDVKIAIGSDSGNIWVNDKMKCYMTLYYTIDEVQNG